jgi:rhodanese-related sulfurtransferase
MSRKHKPLKTKAAGNKKKQRKARKQNQLWIWVGLAFAAIAILAAVILLVPKTSAATHISAAQAYQEYQQGAFFLDVRSQEEWDQAHIANSTLIPLDELQNRLSEIPKDRDIVVVCLTGHRSEEGMTILRNAGFSHASCMDGGLSAWKAAGYPLEGSSP